MNDLSLDSKAILLLTAPLIVGRDPRSAELLTPGEYHRLARRLDAIGARPADLLTPASGAEHAASEDIGRARLERLLARGFKLALAVESWQARAIWTASLADSDYPERVRARLGADAPPVLYGCGDGRILAQLATGSAGALLAQGADRIAAAVLAGAREAGDVVAVLAHGLAGAVLDRDHRNLLLAGRLLLVSPADPNAGPAPGSVAGCERLASALAAHDAGGTR